MRTFTIPQHADQTLQRRLEAGDRGHPGRAEVAQPLIRAAGKGPAARLVRPGRRDRHQQPRATSWTLHSIPPCELTGDPSPLHTARSRCDPRPHSSRVARLTATRISYAVRRRTGETDRQPRPGGDHGRRPPDGDVVPWRTGAREATFGATPKRSPVDADPRAETVGTPACARDTAAPQRHASPAQAARSHAEGRSAGFPAGGGVGLMTPDRAHRGPQGSRGRT